MEGSAEIFRAVLIAWAHVQARTLGHKQCRRAGVGALVRELRDEIPLNGHGPLIGARRDAAQLLESHCRLCGKCREMRAA